MYAYTQNSPVIHDDSDGKVCKVIVGQGATDVSGCLGGGGPSGNTSGPNQRRGNDVRYVPNQKLLPPPKPAGGTPGNASAPNSRREEEAREAVHGNSKSSTKTQHGYEIYDTKTNGIAKVGISGSTLNKNSTSPRANSQVNAWNREAGYERYIASVVEPNIPGREAALQWEKDYSEYMREIDQPMDRHIRP